jgi:hypothetical protein
MKLFVIINVLLFTFCTIKADEFLKAKVYYSDGMVKSGLAAIPKSSGVKTIKFKQTEKSQSENINSVDLKSIVFYQNSDSMIVERIATFKLNNKTKTNDPIWMVKLISGYASLYVYYNAGFSRFTGSTWKNMPGDYQYVCIRNDEKFGSIISMVLDGGIALNNNSAFKRYASEYFKDHKELSVKIEKKEYTFKDIEVVVTQYNQWKKGN